MPHWDVNSCRMVLPPPPKKKRERKWPWIGYKGRKPFFILLALRESVYFHKGRKGEDEKLFFEINTHTLAPEGAKKLKCAYITFGNKEKGLLRKRGGSRFSSPDTRNKKRGGKDKRSRGKRISNDFFTL